MNKQALRGEFKDRLSSFEKAALRSGWQALEEAVVAFCLDRLSLDKGAVVTLFGGLPDEVDLLDTVRGRLAGRGVRPALFGLREVAGAARMSGEMDAYRIEEAGHIRRGKFGIWEPDTTCAEPVCPEQVAVVLVPGLFFAEPQGARLGRGGGFFDRYLARTPKATLRVGVALDWQVLSNLPTEPHDQRVDWVVTDQRVIRCSED